MNMSGSGPGGGGGAELFFLVLTPSCPLRALRDGPIAFIYNKGLLFVAYCIHGRVS